MITQRMLMTVQDDSFVSSWADTQSSRKIGRHINDKGCVIKFDMFGTPMNMFVADAQYRSKLQFAKTGSNNSLNGIIRANATNAWMITGQTTSLSTSPTSDPPVFTDAQLQDMWRTDVHGNPSLSIDLTARQNCDVWMTDTTSNTSGCAVPYSRSLTSFSGVIDGCDIPNLYELMVIFLEMNYIDAIDPTVNSYQTYALGNILGKNNNRWDFNAAYMAWSSTKASSSDCRRIDYQGSCSNTSKQNILGVIPIREL